VQEFNGVRYYSSRKGYYRTATGYMHRDVWQHYHGPIPAGFHVHHINGDKADNRIENLGVIDGSEHSRLHNPAGTKREQLDAARVRRWATVQSTACQCARCGADFMAKMPRGAKWCSRACSAAAYRDRVREAA